MVAAIAVAVVVAIAIAIVAVVAVAAPTVVAAPSGGDYPPMPLEGYGGSRSRNDPL